MLTEVTSTLNSWLNVTVDWRVTALLGQGTGQVHGQLLEIYSRYVDLQN